jgi:hypothetical protein
MIRAQSNFTMITAIARTSILRITFIKKYHFIINRSLAIICIITAIARANNIPLIFSF